MKKLLLILGALVLSTVSAFAADINITSLPVPDTSITQGETASRFDLTTITMTAGDMDLTGAGINFASHTGTTDSTAVGYGLGLFALSADDATGTSTFDMMQMNYSINFEAASGKGTGAEMLFFGGLGFTYMSMDMSIDAGSYETDVWTYGFLLGPQAGIQFGFGNADFKIAPFIMVQSMTGTMTTETDIYMDNYPYYMYSTSDTDVDYTTVSYGMDIKFGTFSLSTMLQQMSGNEEDNDATILQFSFLF